MGHVNDPSPVLLLMAAFSRHDDALQWARRRAVQRFGVVAQDSPIFPFTETDYYHASMGPDLHKVFFAFTDLIDPGRLADIKHETNTWEEEYAALGEHGEPRPLNLDPGYVTLGKLVLASTKDHAHRMYIGRGIYAEVTLRYQHHRWLHHPWTYPDYQRDDYQQFFSQCRDYLHHRLREGAGT